MKYPELTVRRDAFRENLRTVKGWCQKSGLSLALVTKCFLADPVLCGDALLEKPDYFADSRLENLQRLPAGLPKLCLRLSDADRAEETVSCCELSLESEPNSIHALGQAAEKAGKKHKVVLMIDLGDLREGVYFEDTEGILFAAESVVRERGLLLWGVGTNLTCFGGVVPDENNLGLLADIAEELRRRFTLPLPLVSGGNSSSLPLLLAGKMPKGITNLRVGESVLLGSDTARGGKLPGLRRDAFTLTASVIEAKVKPSVPVGESNVNAFGEKVTFVDKGLRRRGILALGRQDTDINDLTPTDSRIEILGGSSDHLLVDLTDAPDVGLGDRISFLPGYGALLKAFTGPFVAKNYVEG